MTRIYATANQKGGVGKTATAVNLAAALAGSGCRVLLIDLDAQRNATGTLGDVTLTPTIAEVLLDGLDLESACWPTGRAGLTISPGSDRMAALDSARGPELGRALRAANARFDQIICDCPPSLEGATRAALEVADEIIVPVQCEYLALEGLTRLLATLEALGGARSAPVAVRYLLTMFDRRNNLSREVAAEVRAHFGAQVATTVVGRSVRVAEAPGFKRTVLEHDPQGPASAAYRAFADEVLAHGG